jgi:hypothetical protein
MIRDAGLALVIVMGYLTLIGTIESIDEIARAKQAQEARAVRAAHADQKLGIVRLAAK